MNNKNLHNVISTCFSQIFSLSILTLMQCIHTSMQRVYLGPPFLLITWVNKPLKHIENPSGEEAQKTGQNLSRYMVGRLSSSAQWRNAGWGGIWLRCKCSVQIVQSCLDGSLLRAAAKTLSRLGLEWHHESELQHWRVTVYWCLL